MKATLGILYSLVPALGLAQPSPGTVASWNVKPVASGGGYTGTVFYVDTNKSDSNSGLSPAQAWKTLHYAATNAAVSNNCIIKVTSGEIFVETNFVCTNLQGLPGSNVVFTTTGSTPAIVSNYWDGGTLVAGLGGFSCLVMDSANITFSNLNFEGNQSFYGYGGPNGTNGECGMVIAGFNKDCHHIIVSNCGFQWHEAFGIAMDGYASSAITHVTNCQVDSCWFNSNSWEGTISQNYAYSYLGTDPNLDITDWNLFFTNDVCSNTPGTATVPGYGYTATQCSNVWYVNCVAHDGGQGPPSAWGGCAADAYESPDVHFIGGEYYNWQNNSGTADGEGITLDLYSVNCSVEGTYVHNCQDAGIYCYGNYGGNTIRFNTTVGNGTDDGVEMSIDVGSPTNLLIYGNNFIATVSWAIPFNDYIGATSSVLANNILWCSNAAYVLTTAGTGWTCWNNDYERGDGAAFSVDWGGTVYSSVAAWQSATGQDANALTANPYWLNGYIDPTFYPATPQTSTNWILSAGNSTLINAAANLGAKFGINNGGRDFLGNPLGTTYNIGAVNASQ